MPFVLLAGIVSSAPKSIPFPAEGQPRASVTVNVDGVGYRCIRYDFAMNCIESLQEGDAVSIQGVLVLKEEKGKVSFFVTAKTVLPLTMRSKRPVAAAMMRP